jgi:hypothetical protein
MDCLSVLPSLRGTLLLNSVHIGHTCTTPGCCICVLPLRELGCYVVIFNSNYLIRRACTLITLRRTSYSSSSRMVGFDVLLRRYCIRTEGERISLSSTRAEYVVDIYERY